MRILNWIEKVHINIASLSGIATLLMVLTILPDVFARNFLGFAIHGVSELNVALLIVLVFVSLAGTQAQQMHFRLGLIDSLLGQGRALLIVRIVSTLISIAIFAILTRAVTIHAYRSTMRGEFEFGAVAFPVWPLRIVVAAGLMLLLLQLLVELLALFRGEMKLDDPETQDH